MNSGTIAILFAMKGEAKGIIEALKLKPLDSESSSQPFEYFGGASGNDQWILSCNGIDSRYGVDNIGLEPAGINAWNTIQRFRPDLVISAGTAGSFRQLGSAIGSIVLSDADFLFHDRRIPLNGYEKYAAGHFPSLDVSDLAKRFGFASGAISSGSSLDYTEAEVTRFLASGAIAKEMEATAIAWACHLLKCPMFAIKSITNLIDVDGDSPKEFVKNFETATRTLTQAVLQCATEISATGVKAWLARRSIARS